MFTSIFLKLTDYAAFRRIIWKQVYELLARMFPVKEWCFMNYGYAPDVYEPYLELESIDEINRYPIQLYHYLCSKINLEKLEILEVGSGRGGGSDYISRYLKPATITGLDIAANAVALANKNYGSGTLKFIKGNAEQLPFADEHFDVIVNIESSHAYGSVPAFLSEVKRVLRPGGYLLLADVRTSTGAAILQQQIRSCNMMLVAEENISKNVVRGIELEQPVKLKRIEENIPRWLHSTFRQFTGVMGSKAHVQLLSGELVYKRFILRKP